MHDWMYDKWKIGIGLVLFLGLATLPFWINAGERTAMPTAVLKPGLTACVEDAAYMRANHMKLLNDWRDSVVRDNDRVYINSKGQHFEKSLTKTCLDCHSNTEQFCGACHQAMAVQPYCWSCHLKPGDRPPGHALQAGLDKATLDGARTEAAQIKEALEQQAAVEHERAQGQGEPGERGTSSAALLAMTRGRADG